MNVLLPMWGDLLCAWPSFRQSPSIDGQTFGTPAHWNVDGPPRLPSEQGFVEAKGQRVVFRIEFGPAEMSGCGIPMLKGRKCTFRLYHAERGSQ